MTRLPAPWIVAVIASGSLGGCASRLPERFEEREGLGGGQGSAAAASAKKASPRFIASIAVGGGEYEHETAGAGGYEGETDAGFFAMRLEGRTDPQLGFGVAIEGIGSDDDLVNRNSEGGAGDMFAYARFDPEVAERFLLPFRLGPYFHSVALDDDRNNVEIAWGGLGLRAEAAPEFWFLKRDELSLGLYGEAAYGVHWTAIELDAPGTPDDYEGHGSTLGASAGLVAEFVDPIRVRCGWFWRQNHEAESDSHRGVRVSEIDTQFRGLALEVAVRF